MPVWFELMVVLLAAYGLGLGLGWLLWGSGSVPITAASKDDTGPIVEEEDA